jgi:hypothetical protein
LPPSRTNGDGNGGQQNGQRHPKLDMRAENVEPFDKHLQDRFPRLKGKASQPINILFF